MSKYELYFVYWLSKVGNNVVIVDYNFNQDKYKLYNNFVFNCSGTSERLNIAELSKITLPELIDGVTENDIKLQPGKIIIFGEDSDGQLNKFLVNRNLKSPPSLCILQDGISKLTYNETQGIPRPNCTDINQLTRLIGPHMFKNDSSDYSIEATEFCKKTIGTDGNANKAGTKLVTFIAYYKRYKLNYKVYIVYGKIDQQIEYFLSFLVYLKKTVIVVDTDGKSNISKDNSWSEIKLDLTVPYHKYPKISKSNSIAYNASREMDNLLYNGQTLGLYRDMQYKTCDVTIINVTFDEMLLLWRQENVVKPSFESSERNVIVPVFYAKILGTCENYLQQIGGFVTDHSIICYSPHEINIDRLDVMTVNHAVNIKGTLFKDQKLMYKNGELLIDNIIGYETFTYRYLDPAVQYHILSKLNLILTDGLIKHNMSESDFVDLLLNTGLNLSRRIQQEMQSYDYTKQSPKLVVLCQDEEELTIQQAIVVTLLHLCGWDIVFIVPTGYNIFGRNLDQRLMQEFNFGNPKFNMNIRELQYTSPKEEKKGFFKKLFG